MRQSECPGSLAVPYSTPSLPTLRGCLSPQPPSPLSPPSLAVAPQMSIKCADLSALAAARPVHCEWVKRLEDEFFLQASYGSGSIVTSNVFCEWVNRLPPDLHLITHPGAHTLIIIFLCWQGDRERAAGLPISPLMDRTKDGVSKAQPGVSHLSRQEGGSEGVHATSHNWAHSGMVSPRR